MKVLAIVQCWNAADPICGFIVPWMEALSERVDELVVLALEQRHPATRRNIRVVSLGKESVPRRARRTRYLARWHRAVQSIFRRHRPDVVFVHMSPVFAVLAAPYAWRAGAPIVTWYAHRQVTPTLRLAHHLSAKVVSSDPASYRYRADKLVVVGQGIDTQRFSPGSDVTAEPRLLLCVGRLSPIKNPRTLVEALERLRKRPLDFRCAFVGDACVEGDRSYAERLRRLVEERGLSDIVHFAGAVAHGEIPSWYGRCFLHVNLCPTGAPDKAVLEAMACGKPVVVSNETFREVLEPWSDLCLFRQDDPDDLAVRLERLLLAPPATIAAMARDLRTRVVERHSLDGLMTRVTRVLEDEALRQAQGERESIASRQSSAQV